MKYIEISYNIFYMCLILHQKGVLEMYHMSYADVI